MNNTTLETDALMKNFRVRIKRALSRSATDCGVDREILAKRLTVLTGDRVSKNMLDGYCAETRANRLPADLVPAITRECGPALLSEMVRRAGYHLIDDEGLRLIEIGQAVQAVQESRRVLNEKIDGGAFDA